MRGRIDAICLEDADLGTSDTGGAFALLHLLEIINATVRGCELAQNETCLRPLAAFAKIRFSKNCCSRKLEDTHWDAFVPKSEMLHAAFHVPLINTSTMMYSLSFLGPPRQPRIRRHSLRLTLSFPRVFLDGPAQVKNQETLPSPWLGIVSWLSLFLFRDTALNETKGMLRLHHAPFLRVLWLHLKVYWFHTPSKAFMIFALSFGILFPAILLAVAFNVSGFSYRTSGKMCIINHENSFTVFWAWTITLAVSSFLLQAFTSGITNTKARKKRIGRASMMAALGLQARGSAHLQTDALNISAFRQRWNQIKAVIQSQWRVASLSIAFPGQAVPFVVQFIKSRTHVKTQKLTACFLNYGLEDQRCLDQKAVLAAAQTSIMAGLTIAAIAGIECFLLTTRTSTLTTWYYICKNPIKTIRYGQYPDTEDTRKPSNAAGAGLRQANSRKRSMDDILTIGHGRRRKPRNSSPAVNFRYRGSLQYPPVGYVPSSISPTNSQRSSRQPSRTNSRTTLSKPPSRRHSCDEANGGVPPSSTHIPMRALSRLQTMLPPPLPTLPQSPNISQGDISASLVSAKTASTPPRVRSKRSVRTESSTALNASLERPEASYPLNRRRSLERQSRNSAHTQSSAALNEVLDGLMFPPPLDRRRSLERQSRNSAHTQSSAALNEVLDGLMFPPPLDRRRSLERQSRNSTHTQSSAALNEVLDGLMFPPPLDRRRSDESG
ncbi:DNA repair protein [Venturia nashicola]|nr:DNA repair protein [Venturia nashicola]